MRIVIDLQACQSASRQRGIGRHSFEMARAIAAAPGAHEVWIALNAAFPESIGPLRHAFSDLVGKERIAVFQTPTPAAMLDPANEWRDRVGEAIRETFLQRMRPDVVHVASLFEGLVDDAVTSVGSMQTTHATATTFYDLIPLLTGESLPTPASVDWYQRKLASLKRSDLLLALSDYARDEAIAKLPVPPERVIVVSTAASEVFRPDALAPDAVSALCARHGIVRPFILYVGGFDVRKNVANLIAAYARLPRALRAQHQLVLAGALERDERVRLRELCDREGLSAADVFLPGRLSDAELAALYGQCAVSCLPSLHEGFGLPALEAMACGAAVVGADATSIPEVIGRSDALFDPADVDALAAKIQTVLTDSAFRTELRAHGLRRAAEFSWPAVAARALSAMEESVERRRRESDRRHIDTGPSQHRPKLAYVSPLPPERTGIAAYSCELLPFLARHYDIELVAQQTSVELPGEMADWPIRSVEWFEANAAACQRVLYHLGNSPAHQWMFDLLERFPGTVVLHDFFLGGVLNWMDETWVAPGTFRARLFESHGYSALLADAAHGRAATVDRYPCNSRVVDAANGIIVHSEEALRLAKAWHGAVGDQWRRIPQLRRLAPPVERDDARRALQIADGDFVTCCFGFVDPAKLDHRLMSAWMGSALARDPHHHLVFVGENHGGEYGRSLLRSIDEAPSGRRIRITGFVDDDTYRRYLCAADAAVQLRGVSRGESPRTALDCLAHGLPLIANAGDSLSALPDDALIRLRADFDDGELAAAIERLAADRSLRARLSQAGRDHVRDHHDPARVAGQFHDVIERFVAEGPRRRYDDLVRQIAAETAGPAPRREDWIATAASIAFDLPPARLRQLLVDVSVLARQDLKTGIERVVRAVLRRLLEHPPKGFRVEPVVARTDRYVYARAFTCRWLGLADALPDGEPIDVATGDVFLGLDWAADVVPQHQQVLARYRAMGLEIAFVVYDLLPLLRPHYYPPGIEEMQRTWLTSIATVADGLVCISRSVETELLEWLDKFGPARDSPLNVGAFRLGADIERSMPTSGDPDEGAALLARMETAPTAVMVGTVEPRKGHRQVIATFEALWREGVDLDLVIIGKKGWMVDDLAATLHAHPERGHRLAWIEHASDAMLDRLYARARVLIAASVGEGFGLPLVEAARNAVPIVARDLPVFREVAGEHAYYFAGTSADDLASALKQWLELHRQARHPRSERLPLTTWTQGTDELLDVVLGGRWNATWLGREAAAVEPLPADVDTAQKVGEKPDGEATLCVTESVAPKMSLKPAKAMSAPDHPIRLDVQDLLRRVRDEIAHHRGEEAAPAAAMGPRSFASSANPIGADAFRPLPDLELHRRFETSSTGYAIEDFTRLQHAEFVRAVYQGLLRREPDPPGLHHFLQKLERGDSKPLILGLVRYSPEGRRHAVPVRGLRWRFALERACEMPVVGPFIRYLVDLARLPTLLREARQNETRLAGQLAAAGEHINAANRTTYGMVAASSHEQQESIGRLDHAIEQHSLSTARLTAWQANAEQRLVAGAATSAASARAALALETGLAGVDSRVKRIEEEEAGKRRAEEDFTRAFDEFYATFEDQFRGRRDDVKARVAVYIPRLVDAGLGRSDSPVLDLGCGRGEWLEVLKDHGLQARGVDTNRTMLAHCRTAGLDATESDALACLRETPAASLGAVTGFHIVEHVSLPYLVSLLKETARTLRPGGTAIFETPNPENVLVGSYTFYLDPTHVNPIPSATLRFLVEAAGLRDVEVVFLHPYPEHERLTAGDQAVETFVNSRFFGPRDYAVIARKA